MVAGLRPHVTGLRVCRAPLPAVQCRWSAGRPSPLLSRVFAEDPSKLVAVSEDSLCTHLPGNQPPSIRRNAAPSSGLAPDSVLPNRILWK